tara:strand:- start:34 stop:267 length:234 start_codon:yes stop_codon:yes gene_type:complete
MSWQEIMKIDVPAGKAGDGTIMADMPRKIVAGAVVVGALHRMKSSSINIGGILHDMDFNTSEIKQVGDLYRAQERLQ